MGDINHKLDNKVFADDEVADKSIQRPKKPRTQAQIEATKKMLEGRKKWAENRGKENKAKKVAKLQEKIAKIEGNNQSPQTHTPQSSNNIEEKVEDNIEVSPNAEDCLLSNSNISTLKEQSNTPHNSDIEDEITPPNVLEDNRSLPINAVRPNASKSKPKRAKKVKRVVNNYIYENEEESSEEEEEIVNNHYIPKKSNAKRKSKRKPKKVVKKESSSDEETSSEEETGFVNYQDLYQQKPQKSIRFV